MFLFDSKFVVKQLGTCGIWSNQVVKNETLSSHCVSSPRPWPGYFSGLWATRPASPMLSLCGKRGVWGTRWRKHSDGRLSKSTRPLTPSSSLWSTASSRHLFTNWRERYSPKFEAETYKVLTEPPKGQVPELQTCDAYPSEVLYFFLAVPSPHGNFWTIFK